MKKIFYCLTLCICIFTAVFCAMRLLKITKEYKGGKDYYDDTFSKYVTSQPSSKEKSDGKAPSDKKNSPPICVDFAALRQDNPDVVGWLYCEGTPVNYPVLQAKDNKKYLNHLMDGSYDKAGSLFLDYRCEKDFTSCNSIIYGHKRKDRSMFGSLDRFKKQSYYEAHPVFWLLTPEHNYRISLLAAYTISENDSFYDYIEEKNLVKKCVDKALKHSAFNTGLNYDDTEQIISFSTCDYVYEGARFVVIGRKEEQEN